MNTLLRTIIYVGLFIYLFIFIICMCIYIYVCVFFFFLVWFGYNLIENVVFVLIVWVFI